MTRNRINKSSIAVGKRVSYPFTVKLHQKFEGQVDETPTAIAIIEQLPNGNSRTMDYATLNAQANRLANYLQVKGVKANIMVSVYLERSIETFIALLAILKAGGVYVPLDKQFPKQHIEYILSQTDSRLMITTENISNQLPDSVEKIFIEKLFVKNASVANVKNKTSTRDNALIMFTSGSTGKPKGVIHSQLQLINRLHWMWQEYPFTTGDIICQRGSIGVMPVMWELLGGLLHGVTTVIIPDQMAKEPRQFLQQLIKWNVTFVTIPTPLLQLIANINKGNKLKINNVRVIIAGGDAMSLSLYEKCRDIFPKAIFIDDFGATEVNTFLHYALHPEKKYKQLPGFKPVNNLTVCILNEKLHLAKKNEVGAVYIGGIAVAKDYLKNHELTEKNFIKINFHGKLIKWYRSGDMGFYQSDGTIKINGRRDHIVKINGMSVELGTIESAIKSHPHVKECAVIPYQSKLNITRLCAYISIKKDSELNDTILRTHVVNLLPRFMLPHKISIKDELPKTPNKKIDRMLLASLLKQENDYSYENNINKNYVIDRLKTYASEILNKNPNEININTEFNLLGFDSITLVYLVNFIKSDLLTTIDIADLYSYPTIQILANQIEKLLKNSNGKINESYGDTRKNTRESLDSKIEKNKFAQNAIAIIGISGRFPGAENIDEFWENIKNGVESITEIPEKRWSLTNFYDANVHAENRSISKWGGFLTDADSFDSLFFNISPAEAKLIDPQQRLCLEESWKAIEHAGYSPDALNGQAVGVFIGAKNGDYTKLLSQNNIANTYSFLGNEHSLLASRIAYFLNLQGPAMVVDTACSSSLVAVHLASKSLLNDECEVALAGGVFITTQPEFYMATSKLGIYSPTGKCRPFDDDADGFVQGEAVAFVVLKRLSAAIRDNDSILGVIVDSAINHDGHSNGIAAPSAQAQSQLQTKLYARSGINPEHINYIETHGTGTKLGDPIEIKALTQSFNHYTQLKQYCAIGSVKANIGHATTAAGIVGLIKILLCFKYKLVPPSINFNIPNKHIHFSETPFYVNSTLKTWDIPTNSPYRLAALNSFGMGGTNAHCILAEPPAREVAHDAESLFYLIVISTKTKTGLFLQLKKWKNWLDNATESVSLRDVSYTSLVGRKWFEERIAFVVNSLDHLKQQIESLLEGNSHTSQRNVKSKIVANPADVPEIIDKTSSKNISAVDLEKHLIQLSQLINKGETIYAEELFINESPLRIQIPTYCFEKHSHWIDNNPIQRLISIKKESSINETQDSRTRLKNIIANTLQLSINDFNTQLPLTEYGIDSIAVVNLKYEFEKTIGREVPLNVLNIAKNFDQIIQEIFDAEAISDERNVAEKFLFHELELSELNNEQLDAVYQQLSNLNGR